MKHTREIKVAVLVIICGFLVYFGLNFLKGVNIFSQDNQYIGIFTHVDGLTEQAPVLVRGYKVGQVDRIAYDFSKSEAFVVTLSIHQDIRLTANSHICLIDNGLMGGKALEVVIPVADTLDAPIYANGDTLPTMVMPGLLASIKEELPLNSLQQTLDNVEQVSSSLIASAHDIKKVTSQQLPSIMQNADTVLADAKQVVRNIQSADIASTVARVDLTLDTIQRVLTTQDGTLGLLLHDQRLYRHIDSTVVSVDSLVNDLKNHPKRYVQFSLFGGKDHTQKQEKK